MKIVADRDIPSVAEAFAGCGELKLLAGREIGREDLRDCQCLAVRTLTRVDRALLEGSAVEFVGSATIGTDHVDLDFLSANGIAFANAPGCNAEAVSEYVLGGIFELSRQRGFDPLRRRAGIVGYGHVGKRVKHKFDALGIDCLLCDPPLAEGGQRDEAFFRLERLLEECDLISIHTPLTREGRHATRHLFDAERLAALSRGCLLINSARGAVVDNAALLELLRRRDDLITFIDTWEGEPLVSTELLTRVDLATPHIAGYSVEGRLRGTQAVLDAAAKHFGWNPAWRLEDQLPESRPLRAESSKHDLDFWQSLLRQHFDIRRDHAAFTAGAGLDDSARARHFDSLRRVYPDRLEYPRFAIEPGLPAERLARTRELGFTISG